MSSSYTINFYREECQSGHDNDLTECNDDCRLVEMEYIVTGSVSPYSPRSYSNPAEGGEVEDVTVTLNKKEIDFDDTFSTKEQDQIVEQLAQAAADDDGGYDEDGCEDF